MIPYQTDPSLHSGEPAPPVLDDGFSPREPRGADGQSEPGSEPASDPAALPPSPLQAA